MQVILLSTDLMLCSRVGHAANDRGMGFASAANLDAAVKRCDDDDACLVVVDLRTPGLQIGQVVETLRDHPTSTVRIAACAPHVREADLNAAREAGCDFVLTRGQLDRDVNGLLEAMR